LGKKHNRKNTLKKGGGSEKGGFTNHRVDNLLEGSGTADKSKAGDQQKKKPTKKASRSQGGGEGEEFTVKEANQ